MIWNVAFVPNSLAKLDSELLQFFVSYWEKSATLWVILINTGFNSGESNSEDGSNVPLLLVVVLAKQGTHAGQAIMKITVITATISTQLLWAHEGSL